MNYELNWDDTFLPMYGNTILIPAGAIMWRGFDPKFPAISPRPAYYGSRTFAQGYADKYGVDAKPFITTRPIRLLDIRYMKVLLSQLFEDNKQNLSDRSIIIATTVAFGLCSLGHQVKLFKERYAPIFLSSEPQYDNLKKGLKKLENTISPSFYEQKGYRIAETTNDAIVMGFLKELFSDKYDGYISPNIITPFHIEKTNFLLNSELVLFDPPNSGIQLLTSMPSKLQKATINYFILHSGQSFATIDTRGMKTSYYNKTKGGGKRINVCDDYNNEYECGNKNIIKLYKQGEKYGRVWKGKTVKAYNVIAPGPEVDPTIFLEYNNIAGGKNSI
jgi:hypothetical protein